jgi:PadR family transcriptional regulator
MVEPRMTVQTLVVLKVLLAAPDAEIYGLDVIRESNLAPGTVYPLLQRLLDAGWVTDRWESLDASEQGRPARRYYRLTPGGIAKAQAALSKADRRRASLVRLLDTPHLRAEEG